MPSDTPFFDAGSGTLDVAEILSEAIPLARLIGLFVGVSLLPFILGAFSFGTGSLVGAAFVLLGQFVLAVGAGIVLLYVVVRARQLSNA
ncbi:hypothetical protein [Halobellus ruber]|uniref:Uncharacterized protein n=1 Tax=Halobellus ruber TaxID=2761102 RepID=A0A7J9SNG2_9EURY|nr:hypothetical protein [Halobellus ruber]MBB6647726.1 hypothetical protein [Halobellus ruber]